MFIVRRVLFAFLRFSFLKLILLCRSLNNEINPEERVTVGGGKYSFSPFSIRASSWRATNVRAHFENDNVKINANCLGALRAIGSAAIKLSHYRLKFDLNVSPLDPSTPDAVNNSVATNTPSLSV